MRSNLLKIGKNKNERTIIYKSIWLSGQAQIIIFRGVFDYW